MAFHGLFIGVDRYEHPMVTQLSCAVRDATALHALFADNFGGDPVLLIDTAATRDTVVGELRALATAAAGDVVVIAFSGHGSATHELLPVNVDPFHLAHTALPLDELTELVEAIPARTVVCILDCCFSGGAGAKVLSLPIAARAAMSTEQRLARIAGEGRMILTASAADQPAWEDPRAGHGLLTKALIDVLLGTDTAAGAGAVESVGVYGLLARAVAVVTAGAGVFGATQTPTLRGRIDGELRWPTFSPGERCRRLFPERHRAPVTGELASLLPHGIPAPVVEAWRGHIPALNDLQQAAINEVGLLTGEHVLVSAPTSSGKTLLGELVAAQAAGRGQRTVFLLSTKALVNDKYAAFTETYTPLGLRVRRATGEIDDDVADIVAGRFDLALFTYEKFAGLALSAPHLLHTVAAVVVDEVQTLVDAGRGANLEFLLTLLRAQRARGVEPQLLALSAVLGDLAGLPDWLGAKLLISDHRPVPLREGVLRPDGTWRYRDQAGDEHAEQRLRLGYVTRAQDMLIPLVRQLVAEGKQVLVFRNSRGATRGCASYLAQALGLPPATEGLGALPAGDPSGATAVLRRCLTGGVAFHNAELGREEKLAIERAFRAPGSGLRVIVATTTLAQGVNTPAEAVVVVELDHPAGRISHPYTTAEYKNIVGRAGRLGLAAAGESYLLVGGPVAEQQLWRRYLTGTPETVTSQLLRGADVATLILRVLAAGESFTAAAAGPASSAGLSADGVADFLSLSFAAHQARLAGERVLTAGEVADVVDELASAGLIATQSDGALALTDLGRLAGGGVVGARGVLTLARALAGVPVATFSHPISGPATVLAAAQLTPELDSVYISVNGRGVAREIQTFYGELHRQGARVAGSLRQAPERNAAARAKKAVACLLWTHGVPRAQIDEALTRHEREQHAAGTAQAVTARTADVLPVVVEVARLTHPDLSPDTLTALTDDLPVRLELGVPASCARLGRHFGQALPRSGYLRLNDAALTLPEQLLTAGTDAVAAVLAADLGPAAADVADRLLQWAADQDESEPPSLAELMPGADHQHPAQAGG